MSDHAILNPHQREWMRGQFAQVTAAARRDRDRDVPRFADEKSELRVKYVVADALFDGFAGCFARYAVEGDDTMDFTLPILRVVNRYRNVCGLAYLGNRWTP